MSQKRTEGWPAEVDATDNVTEDAGVGLQRLALEVVRLLAHVGGTEWLEIEEVVLSDPTSRQVVDPASTSPFGKSFGDDTKGVSSDMGADPLSTFINDLSRR